MEERGAHLPARRVPRRLMRIDVNAFLGAYPYRRVPATSPDGLLHAMTRAGIDEAWVSHLPSLFWRQPMEGNAWLYATAAREPRFKPVPALHPGLSGWEGALGEAADRAAPAGRCDPLYYGLDPAGPEMRVLAAACGAAHLPLMMAVRLEDGRQRHPNDRAGELPAAAIRALIRSDEDLRLLITHADRGFIEEVHFGSTPEEAVRLWWDVSWIWGPRKITSRRCSARSGSTGSCSVPDSRCGFRRRAWRRSICSIWPRHSARRSTRRTPAGDCSADPRPRVGSDSCRPGPVPWSRVGGRRAAGLRLVDGGPSSRRRGRLGAHRSRAVPVARPAAPSARGLAGRPPHEPDRRGGDEPGDGRRGEGGRCECAARLSAGGRSGGVSRGTRPRAPSDRVLSVRGRRRRRLRQPDPARHPRAPQCDRDQGGHARLGGDVPTDRRAHAGSPGQAADHR